MLVRRLRWSSSAWVASRCAPPAASCWLTRERSPRSALSRWSSTSRASTGAFAKLSARTPSATPGRRCAHRLPRLQFAAGPRTAQARRSRHLLRQPAVVGVEAAPHRASAQICPQDAGDLPLRRKVLPRTRHRGGICRTSAGRPAAPTRDSREQFAAEYGLDPRKPWIALLPGSRHGEVSRIFPTCWKQRNFWVPITFT